MIRESIQDRDWGRAAIAALAAMLFLAAVLAAVRSADAAEARRQVDAVYQKAFYETCELTESMAANYAKLTVSASSAQAQVLLNDISRQSQGAISNLSMLPLGQETVSATVKFVNQAGDFAETLSQKLALGQEISQEDYDTMRTISASAMAFTQSLNALAARYAGGEKIFSAEDMEETGDESLYPLTGAAAEYPTLIYDGPFADVERGGTYRALSGLYVVSPEEAAAILRRFLGTDAPAALEGESDLGVKCYEFTVDMGGYSVSVGVTQQGGRVLYMLSDAEGDPSAPLDEAGVTVAREFLASRGYGDMEMSYFSGYDGVMTVNFAAVQDGVVLYPDLVKVQVDAARGAVVGLEAHGYLQNHVPRALPTPAVTEARARSSLSPMLTAQGARLCVIPQDGGEYLCYEITATSADGMFMVYLDAMTGEEREILQVVDSDMGTLVM